MPILDLLSGDTPITDADSPAQSQQSAPQASSAPQLPVDSSPSGPIAPPQADSIVGLGAGLPPTPAPGAPPAKPESRWHAVLSGALNGLLMGGVPGAVVGAVSPGRVKAAQQQQQQFANDRLQTADATAAIQTARAAIAKAQLANLPQETQDAIDTHGEQLATFWAKLGYIPSLITDNSPEAAYAGLQQLAKINGGQIPQHTEVRLANKLVFYTAPKTGNDLDSLGIVNNLRSVEGLQPISHDDWAKPNFNRQAASAEANALLAPSGDALNPNKIQGELARRQVVRANYAALAPDSPEKQANLKQLDSTIAMMKSVQAGELKNMLDTKRQEENIKAGAQAAAAARVQDRQDKTENNRRYDAFTKSHIPSLEKSDQTYSQFKTILDDANAGKMTGAESVVGLFNAIGISATPLKGMGFRINNSTVEEHADALGVGSKLYRTLLNLKSGDVVTPQQVNDYAKLAVQARHDLYMSSVDEASRENIPLDFLPKGRGRQLDRDTAQIYADAFGDKNQARAAAKAAGWRF